MTLLPPLVRPARHFWGHESAPTRDSPESRPRTVRVDGATVHYRVAGAIGRKATLVVGGLMGVDGAYRQLTDSVAEDETAICIKQSRLQGRRSLAPHNLLHPQGLLSQSITAVMQETYAEFGIEDFDLVGHSWGGLTVYRKALQQKQQQSSGPRINSIALLAAAGTTGEGILDNASHIPGLLSEAFAVGTQNRQLGLELITFVGSNLLRTTGEVIHAGTGKIDPDQLYELSQGDDAIRTLAMHWRRDPAFPAVTAQAYIGQAVESFVIGNPETAGHFASQLYPELVAAEYRQARESLLSYS